MYAGKAAWITSVVIAGNPSRKPIKVRIEIALCWKHLRGVTRILNRHKALLPLPSRRAPGRHGKQTISNLCRLVLVTQPVKPCVDISCGNLPRLSGNAPD